MIMLRTLGTSASLLMLTSCGAVYVPQQFELPREGYGYHRTDHVDIEVIPLTFQTMLEANADGYQPRGLPNAFAELDPVVQISTRERIAQAGLDIVDPAQQFAPLPYSPRTYDPASQVLQPLPRRDDLTPTPVLELQGGGVSVPSSFSRQPVVGSSYRLQDDVAGTSDNELYGSTGSYILYSTGKSTGAYGKTGAQGPTFRRRQALLPRPPLSPPRAPAQVRLNPPPRVTQEPYRIGPGDVIGLLSRLQPLNATGDDQAGLLADATKRLRVQGDGEIFIPQAGAVDIGGLTLAEARRVIFDKLIGSDLDFDFGVEILEFNSKSITVSGPQGAQVLPVTVKPLTLGEAIAAAGGLGTRPDNTVIRILRGGNIYEIPADDLLASSDLANRILLNNDVVSIAPVEDVEGALAYFDQQLRIMQLEREAEDRVKALERQTLQDARSRRTDELAIRAEARAERAEARTERAEARALERETLENARARRAEELADRAEARADRAEARTDEAESRARVQFDIAMETYRLEAERLRQEATIARAVSQREVDTANEAARIANLEARQTYLNRLRELQDANNAALRAAEQDRRTTLRDNAAERAREREERRALLELELSEERGRLDQIAALRQQTRELFQQRVGLGAVERDYVTIAGEANAQSTFPLPFEGRVTLNRIIYETGKGPNAISGDTSEIYVIRRPIAGARAERLVAYHLDASNAASLAVATAFEMRPNDVVFINPQPVTNWNRVLTQLLPSTSFLFNTAAGVSSLGSN